MLSYLDPRMVPLYQESDAAKLADSLRRLGVEYVQVPDYLIPPVSNSSLMSLLSNPDLAELMVYNNFSQLYRLRSLSKPAAKPYRTEVIQNLFDWAWVEYPRVGVGGPAFALRGLGKGVVSMPSSSSSTNSFLPRSYSHMLEVGSTGSDGRAVAPIPVKSGREYVLKLEVEGEGYIRVWVWKGKTTDPDAWQQTLAGDFALSPQTPRVEFSRRMRIDGQASSLRIGIERTGVSRLVVKSASLVELGSQ